MIVVSLNLGSGWLDASMNSIHDVDDLEVSWAKSHT